MALILTLGLLFQDVLDYELTTGPQHHRQKEMVCDAKGLSVRGLTPLIITEGVTVIIGSMVKD